MTWTTPVDQSAGFLVTSVVYNQQIIDNLNHLYAQGVRDFITTDVGTPTTYTPDLNSGTYQRIRITSGAGGSTLTIAATAHTPGATQTAILFFDITNTTGNIINYTWDTTYVGTTISLPTSISGGAANRLLFIYNAALSKWSLILSV